MALKIYLLLPDVYAKLNGFHHTEHQLQPLLVTINQLLDVVRCEKGTELYYDAANLKEFDTQIREIVHLVEFPLAGLEPIELLIVDSLNKFAKEIKGGNFQCRYTAWNFPGENTVLNHQTKLLIKMVEEILRSAGDDTKTPQKFLLLNFTDLNPTGPFLPIIKDCGKETCPQLVCLPQVTETDKLELWLRDHRQPRVFNKNPKHGEQGKGVKANKGETVSRLLCTSQEAQALLHTAIGCAAETKELYNFDRQHNQYIVFKDENTPNNSYHGYHIEINNSGEIPEAIRKRLGVAV